MHDKQPKSGDAPAIDSKDLAYLKFQVIKHMKTLLVQTSDSDRVKYQTQPVSFDVSVTGTKTEAQNQLAKLLELDGWLVCFEPCGLLGRRMIVTAPPMPAKAQ